MKDLSLYEKIPSLENNFTVKFRVYNSKSALLPHWHEHIELIYLLSGECEFFINGGERSARAGDLLIVNSAEVHSFEIKDGISYYSMLLFPRFFDDTELCGIRFQSLVSGDGEIGRIFDDIHSEYSSNEPMSDMMLKSHTYKLVALLGRKYPASDDRPRANDSARLQRLNEVLEYISKNYGGGITTRDLAAMCYLSEAHFCRFFKNAVGKSCTEYINQYRIEKASVLLTNTSDTIAAVAASCGFDDINYFSRVFKQIKGVAPGKYRKNAPLG